VFGDPLAISLFQLLGTFPDAIDNIFYLHEARFYARLILLKLVERFKEPVMFDELHLIQSH